MNDMLPRLLKGVGDRPLADLGAHEKVHGRLEPTRYTPVQIIDLAHDAGLRGHGGAAFPAAMKMRAVAARRKPKYVVANGTEGEPASKKDSLLLRTAPHLVLDGITLATRAVGARQAVLAIGERNERALQAIDRALEERRRLPGQPQIEVVQTPERYLSGQETALINLLNGGTGKPTFGARPFERGLNDRPTLVQNVETLAHLALIARHGAGWFRQLGTDRHPGSALVTVSGAVSAPGVYEIAHGTRLSELLYAAGGGEPLGAVLIGGYFGSWLRAELIPELALSAEGLQRYGASLGAGVIVALPQSACPVAETARVADWFAAESAGQCGPCLNGLHAIADTVQRIASGTAAAHERSDLERWLSDLPRRGACQHPDGAVRFISSGLRAFAADFLDHARHGRCERCENPPVLPACAYV
jgi:NADH:ubiquinone oxidoreductase subunit F (NADH-binding)